MVKTLTETMLGVMAALIDFLIEPMLQDIIKLFETFLGGLSTGLSNSWSNPIVNIFLYIANGFSIVILIMSVLFFLLKIAQEEKRNWYVIFNCFFKAIIFVTFNQLCAKACFLITDSLVSGLSLVFTNTASFGSILGELTDIVFAPVFAISMVVATIGFIVVSLKRFSLMFIQMMIAPFYVPFVLMGDSQKSAEWVLTTVSIGFTYLIQYILFYSGIILITYADGDFMSYIFSLALLFGTFSVPAQMQKFGFASSGGVSLNSMYTGANIISSMMKMKV